METIFRWLDERLEIGALWRALFLRKVPLGTNWWYTLGAAALFVFLLQVVTGMFLALYYAPTPDHAYDSIQYIMNEVTFGRVVRGIHHWGGSAMVVLVVAHLLVTFVMAAYKYPREMTWVVGVFLLLLTFAFGFTGYLLPWDEKAYWATTVGTNMAGTVPLIGDFLLKMLRGGSELGAVSLLRFYAFHALILPALAFLFVGLHMYMVVQQGVSVRPALWEVAQEKLALLSARLPAGPKLGPTMTKEEYHERFAPFKAQGHPYWPDILYEDFVVALAVFVVLIVLAVSAGVPLESPADPTNTAYIPRPEWYFMFIFELLRFFPGELEWVGVALVPTLGVLGLLILPFYDRRPTRLPHRRPLAMGLAALSLAAIAFLTFRAFATTPPPERLTAAELAGRRLYQAQNCAACHAIKGSGGNAGPALDGIGSQRDLAYIHQYIENPKGMNPNATMPPFLPPLSHQEVEQISLYLMTLK